MKFECISDMLYHLGYYDKENMQQFIECFDFTKAVCCVSNYFKGNGAFYMDLKKFLSSITYNINRQPDKIDESTLRLLDDLFDHTMVFQNKEYRVIVTCPYLDINQRQDVFDYLDGFALSYVVYDTKDNIYNPSSVMIVIMSPDTKDLLKDKLVSYGTIIKSNW